MPCLLGCLALLAPRFVIFLLFLFSDFIGRAYDTVVWPLLGFFLAPMTTLAYAAAVNWNGTVTGGYFVMVLVAALMDLGLVGGAGYQRRTLLVVRRGGSSGGSERDPYDHRAY